MAFGLCVFLGGWGCHGLCITGWSLKGREVEFPWPLQLYFRNCLLFINKCYFSNCFLPALRMHRWKWKEIYYWEIQAGWHFWYYLFNSIFFAHFIAVWLIRKWHTYLGVCLSRCVFWVFPEKSLYKDNENSYLDPLTANIPCWGHSPSQTEWRYLEYKKQVTWALVKVPGSTLQVLLFD